MFAFLIDFFPSLSLALTFKALFDVNLILPFLILLILRVFYTIPFCKCLSLYVFFFFFLSCFPDIVFRIWKVWDFLQVLVLKTKWSTSERQVDFKVKVRKGISSLAITLKGGTQVSTKRSTSRGCVRIKRKQWTNRKNTGDTNTPQKLSKIYYYEVRVETFEFRDRKG